MKVDRNKILQKAQAYVQKNQLDKAIAEYETLLRADPSDVNSALRLAGLYFRVDRTAEAVEAYLKAGELYIKTGFFQKALAAYKQALQLQPTSPLLLQQIADVYLKMNMKGQAVEHFAKAGEMYGRAGRHAEALAMMTRVIEAEPGRPDYKAKYGELLFQTGRHDEALVVFRGLVELLKLEGQWEELARFCERVLQLFPRELDLAIDLARVYLRLGMAPKAQQRLKMIYDAGVRNAEVFDLLARSYVLLGKNDRAVGAYIEKVRRLHAESEREEVQRTWRRILEIDPTNEQALRALGETEEQAPVVTAKPGPAKPAARRKPESEALRVVEVIAEDDGPARGAASASPAAASPESNSEFSGILQEASIYMRFGIPEKAVRKIDQILARDPNNIPALIKRVELLKASKPGDAIDDLLHLAELYEGLGNMEAADDAIARAKEIDPKNPRLLEFLGEAGLEEVADDVVVGGVADVVELGGDAEVAFPDAEEFLDDAGDKTDFDIAAADADVEVEVEVEHDDRDAVVVEAAASAGVDPLPEYQNELDEIHFYIDTEHYAEATAMLGELRRRFGNDPRFAELEARIPSGAASAAKLAPRPAAPAAAPKAELAGESSGAIFDLARELELDDDLNFGGAEASPGAEDVPDFEEIFDAFKKGVKEQLSDEDADAHYDLGIAYMEMGLIDDAVSEFEIARRSAAKAPEACYMAAVALGRKGDLKQAADYYRAGLEYPSITDGMYLNLHYELALALDEIGDFRGALQHFRAVLEKDKTYREVGQRLKAMKEKLEAKKGAGSHPSGSGSGTPSNVTYL